MNLPLERYIHTLAIEQGPAPEMVSAFQTDSTLSLVTTYAAHGSLWDRMCSLGEGGGETSQAGRMAENEIRWWGHQMVRAIDWLHGQGFVHRYVPRLTSLMVAISSHTTFSSILPLDLLSPTLDQLRP